MIKLFKLVEQIMIHDQRKSFAISSDSKTFSIYMKTTCSISMLSYKTAFFWKINLKSKYITCYIPKGLTHPTTNPAWQSLTSPNKHGARELGWDPPEENIFIKNAVALYFYAKDNCMFSAIKRGKIFLFILKECLMLSVLPCM